MEKREFEARLRTVLAEIPEGETRPTMAVAETVFGPDPDSAQIRSVIRVGDALGLCQKGPPREGRGAATGKTVYPRVWRRLVTEMGEPRKYTLPPSQMALGDACGTLIGKRQERGTFGRASDVRNPIADLETTVAELKLAFEKEQGWVRGQLGFLIDLIERKGEAK